MPQQPESEKQPDEFPFKVRSRIGDKACAAFRHKAVAEAFIIGLRNPEEWYVDVPENYAPPSGPGANES